MPITSFVHDTVTLHLGFRMDYQECNFSILTLWSTVGQVIIKYYKFTGSGFKDEKLIS